MSQTTSICVNVRPGSFHLRVITTWILLFMPICLLLLFHCRVFLIPPFWCDVWQDWLVPRRPHRTLLLWHLPKIYIRRKCSPWSLWAGTKTKWNPFRFLNYQLIGCGEEPCPNNCRAAEMAQVKRLPRSSVSKRSPHGMNMSCMFQ